MRSWLAKICASAYARFVKAPSARVVVVSSTAHLGANKELMEGKRAVAVVGWR